MLILGYISAIANGMVLGLIGGGGSILTVPVLVYLIGVSPVLATAYSLFVVGITSLTDAVTYMYKGQVSYRAAIIFAIPAFISVYITRKIIIPAIPKNLFTIVNLVVTKNLAIMLFFAGIMLWSSLSMIRSAKRVEDNFTTAEQKYKYTIIFIEGIVVGFLTGLVGAGGGFLIIPALVLLSRLPMKLAVDTSLLIIAAKPLIGFIGDIEAGQSIDWLFLLSFSVIAICGILIGSFLSKFVTGAKLKPAFG
jgi:uncharacterized membrane protein YfcA